VSLGVLGEFSQFHGGDLLQNMCFIRLIYNEEIQQLMARFQVLSRKFQITLPIRQPLAVNIFPAFAVPRNP
jgi:hypothetical protein